MANATNISAAEQAISTIESGSAAGNYGALGPTTSSGDRAYGRYQVMGANIPAWTQKYFGQSLTPAEFLTNHAAQDAVFDGEFGGYLDQYGISGAANKWFTGSANPNPNASDGGTTASAYSSRATSLFDSFGGSGATSTDGTAPVFNSDGTTNGSAGGGTGGGGGGGNTPDPTNGQGGIGGAFGMNTSIAQAIIQAGNQLSTTTSNSVSSTLNTVTNYAKDIFGRGAIILIGIILIAGAIFMFSSRSKNAQIILRSTKQAASVAGA